MERVAHPESVRENCVSNSVQIHKQVTLGN